MESIRIAFENEKKHFKELMEGKKNGLQVKRICTYSITDGLTGQVYDVNEFEVVKSTYAKFDGVYLEAGDYIYITDDLLEALMRYTNFGDIWITEFNEEN